MVRFSRTTIEEGDHIVAMGQIPLREAFEQAHTVDILKANLEAIQRQSKILRTANYEQQEKTVKCPECERMITINLPVSFDLVAKAMAYTAKVVDEIARLLSFVQGGPDSRPDFGTSLLEALTGEQLEQLQDWIRENQAKVINEQSGDKIQL